MLRSSDNILFQSALLNLSKEDLLESLSKYGLSEIAVQKILQFFEITASDVSTQ